MMRAMFSQPHRVTITKRLWCLVVCCLGLVWSVGCGGNVGNDKFREGYGGVKGILLLKDGSIAANARVQVVNLPSIATTTDSEGRFQLNDVPAGRRELVLTHARPFAARVSVWVVHRFTVTLNASLSILTPTATLTGQISARPRLDAKGIQVLVKGMPYTTKTDTDDGAFRLPGLPEGCHILVVSSPYFVRKELPNVCVKAGEATSLPKSIALSPSVPCKSDTPRCAQGGLCIEGFCVPDPGGEVALTQEGVLSLGKVPFEQTLEVKRTLLENKGPGQVRVLRIDLQDSSKLFSMQLPQLPLVLQKGEQLAATFRVVGNTLGVHQAIVQVDAVGATQAVHAIKLSAEVLPHPSNCLTARPGTLDLGTIGAGKPHPFTLTVANRCGQTLLLQAGKDAVAPSPATCGASWLGQFSMKACVDLAEQLPAKIPPGGTVSLHLTITPQAYGVLSGELYLPHDELPGARLQVPLHGVVVPPGVAIAPQPLDFGDVAPEEQRTLWLALRTDKPLTTSELQGLTLRMDASGATIFQPGSARVARLPEESRVIYIPIVMKAPLAGRLLAGTLHVGGLPGLEGREVVLPLKARITSPNAPTLPTELLLGATDGCAPPAQALRLHNPSTKPVIVTKLASATQGDFSFQASLPVTIPPQSTATVAQLQFIPAATAMRAYGQIKVTMTYGEGETSYRTIALQASTGYRVHETFQQAKAPNVDVLLYVDHKIDQARVLPALEGGVNALVAGLGKHNYRILPMVGDAEAGLSPLTPNPITELRRLLQPSPDTSQGGLAALHRMLLRRNAPANTVTAAVFVSSADDQSPYGVARYLPQEKMAPFSVFAAIPEGQCAAATPRYKEAIMRTNGATLDLCTAQPGTWRLWGERIQRFVTGERVLYPLQRTPKGANASTIQLATPLLKLPAEQWSYDPESNEVSLGHPAFLPPGQTLTISYYTQCK